MVFLLVWKAGARGAELRLQLLAKEEWIAARTDRARDRLKRPCVREKTLPIFYCGEFTSAQHRHTQQNEQR
jgi:hypothetical protein